MMMYEIMDEFHHPSRQSIDRNQCHRNQPSFNPDGSSLAHTHIAHHRFYSCDRHQGSGFRVKDDVVCMCGVFLWCVVCMIYHGVPALL
jgi:hypothetical protein